MFSQKLNEPGQNLRTLTKGQVDSGTHGRKEIQSELEHNSVSEATVIKVSRLEFTSYLQVSISHTSSKTLLFKAHRNHYRKPQLFKRQRTTDAGVLSPN